MGKRVFDRRRFLQAALFGSGALLTTRVGRARAQSLSGKKVIVVGGGISGLGAARSLARQGANVTVLEANPHIGGRLRTDFSMGAPFEFGAGWVHGPSGSNPVRGLVDAVGGKLVVTDDDNLVVFDAHGNMLNDRSLDKINADWAAVLKTLDDALDNGDRRSLRDAIRDLAPRALDDPGVMWALSAYTEFSKGGPIENLSALYFNADKAFPSADAVVSTGYDKILGPLADGLDIRLSTVVRQVKYGSGGVNVLTDKGRFDGDFVICSVPLGVLKAEKITFTPALPEGYSRKISRQGFGSVTKIAFKFEEAFWDTETQYFGVMGAEKGRWNYWLNYRTFSNQNIILGLSMGAYALRADRMSDRQMAEDALAVLRTVWGEDVGTPVQTLTTHWSIDPHAFGAYSYPRPDTVPSDFDDLGEAVEKCLFLCGEHTIFDYAGTTHGAYMSGLRSAEGVIAATR